MRSILGVSAGNQFLTGFTLLSVIASTSFLSRGCLGSVGFSEEPATLHHPHQPDTRRRAQRACPFKNTWQGAFGWLHATACGAQMCRYVALIAGTHLTSVFTLCAHQQHPARQLLLKIPYCGVAPAEVLWHMLRGVSVPLAPKLAKILQKLSLRSPTTYLLIRALWLMSSL